MQNIILIAVPTLGAYLLSLNWEIFALLLIIFIFDIVTGVLKSMKSGNYSSRAMKQGLIKKAGEIIIILVIVIVKRMAILSGLAISTVPIFEVFVIALAFKEVSSILENWMAMGVQLPSFLMKWFKIAQKEAISELTEKDQN